MPGKSSLASMASRSCRARSSLAAGMVYDRIGERGKAQAEYRAAIAISPDSAYAESARKYQKTPYQGK